MRNIILVIRVRITTNNAARDIGGVKVARAKAKRGKSWLNGKQN